MYLNQVTLVGNLTRDPEMKALPSGQNVTNFGIATNRYYKDKDGNRQDAVEYHNLVAFGKQAELIAQYLQKGSQALVNGRLQTRSWEGDDGKKNYRTEIIVETVQFGSKAGDNNDKSDVTPEDQARRSAIQAEIDARRGKAADAPELPEEEINPADIPF